MEIGKIEAEVKGFHEWKTGGRGLLISPGAYVLMIELFFIFNSYDWPEWLEIATDTIAAKLGIAKNTLVKYRKELAEAGALEINDSPGGRATGYKLLSFVGREKIRIDPKPAPGLTAVLCIASAFGVYWNDYAERKISRLVQRFSSERVIKALIDTFIQKKGVNIDEFERRFHNDGKFGREISRGIEKARRTDFTEGAIQASAGNADETLAT